MRRRDGLRVVLLDADERLGRQVVQTLAEARRYRITALSFRPGNGLRYSRRCDYRELAGWRWDNGPEQLDVLPAGLAGNILLPVTPLAVEWAARHRAALGRSWLLPPLPDPETFALVSDKARFAEFVEARGIDSPASRRLPPDGEPELDGLSFPLLVKPRHGGGGAGITLVDSRAALRARLRSSAFTDCIVQSFIPGEDLSCGVLCHEGRLLAAVVYACLSRREDYGAFYSIQTVDDGPALDAVRRLMWELRWTGVANVDLRRATTGRTYVLEVNPRFWGSLLGVLVAGVNFPDLLCRAAVGDIAAVAPTGSRRFFSPLDSVALWRERLLRPWRGRRAGCSWNESALRFVCRDPIPYWLAYWEHARGIGLRAALRTFVGHPPPRGAAAIVPPSARRSARAPERADATLTR